MNMFIKVGESARKLGEGATPQLLIVFSDSIDELIYQ
jgi:hypothetical protein